MRDAALAAIAGAGDLSALKQARLDHAGDRSPLALANREIGALPPQARKEAGQRVGQARGAVTQALAARTTELEAEHEERMLVEETVDVTVPTQRAPRGSRHPITLDARADRRHLRRDGLGGGRGAAGRGRVAQLRRPQPRARPPGPLPPGHVLDRARRPPRRAAHPDLAGAGPDHAHPDPAHLRHLTRPGLPHRRVRRDAQPDVPPGRGPRRRRGHHHGPPQGHARPLRHAGSSARASRPASARRTSRSPSRRRSSTSCASSAATSTASARTAAPAVARAGSSGAAAASSTRGSSRRAGSTPTGSPGSPSAWASTGR